MGTMNIETKSVKAIELFVCGISLGVFLHKESWNELTKIERIKDGQFLIIGNCATDAFFYSVFGLDDLVKGSLINGSVDLIQEIKTIAKERRAEENTEGKEE